jgi:hypothetical protein
LKRCRPYIYRLTFKNNRTNIKGSCIIAGKVSKK